LDPPGGHHRQCRGKIAKYGAHPVVRNFADNTLFPQTGGISLRAPEGWQGSVLMDTRASSWSETGEINGPIQIDKGKDIRGPLNLAVALSHRWTSASNASSFSVTGTLSEQLHRQRRQPRSA
jgi:hypothetical protein